jgi:hypothetical protein
MPMTADPIIQALARGRNEDGKESEIETFKGVRISVPIMAMVMPVADLAVKLANRAR